MKQSINFSQFCDAFRDMNHNDNFTYEGKKALFEWIEALDDDCGTETELDVIALCCEFSEYGSAVECINDAGYDLDLSEHDEGDAQEDAAVEYLNDHTMVILFDGGIIIQDF